MTNPDTDKTSPIISYRGKVLPEWIDWNGHMNVAYYVMAFDLATDALFDQLNMGKAYREGTNCSTFTLELPLAIVDDALAAEPQRDRQVVSLVPGQGEWRVLIVDDMADNRLLLRGLMGPLGVSLREAEDGQQAIECWREWQPHLIWMDMRMPVLDGYEAARRIKAEGTQTKIIALTASAFEEDRQKVLDAGCDDFLRKPFRDADLFDMMTEHLDIRFVYDNDEQEETAHADVVLTATALADLQPEWRSAMNLAARTADGDRMLELIGELGGQHSALADALTGLVRDYEFDRLAELARGTATT